MSDIKTFNTVSALKYWCYKILPLVYDDSLSYYEVLCRVTKKLNEVINNTNNIPEIIADAVANGGFLDNLQEQIAELNDKDSKTATADRYTGELIWLNGDLYRITRPMLAGDQYIESGEGVTGNIEKITLEEWINRYLLYVKAAITLNDQKYNVIASKPFKSGELLWWKGNLYRTKQAILLNEYLSTDVNLEAINLEQIIKDIDARVTDARNLIAQETSDRESADTTITNNLNKEISDRESADTTITNNLNKEISDRTELISKDNSGNTVVTSTSGALYINTKNPMRYSKPISEPNFSEFFDYVPMFDVDGVGYNLLTYTENTKKLDTLLDFYYANVLHYGADPTGVNDSTEAIQTALRSGKKHVVIPPGTYICNWARIPSDVSVHGYGAHLIATTGNTIFTNDADGITGGWVANSNITIEGIDFSAPNPDSCTPIGMGHCTNITIRDCTFHDIKMWHFVEFNSCKSCTIDNCYFYNYGTAGNGFTEMIQLDYAINSVAFPWFGPYDSTPTQDTKIVNCSFIGNPDILSGKIPAAIGNHTDGNQVIIGTEISNCYFKNLGSALKFVTCHNINFNNNYVTDCNTGVYLGGDVSFIKITNNILIGRSNWINNVDYRGIFIEYKNESHMIDVIGNNISSFGGHGVTLQGTFITCINNHITNNGMHGLYAGVDDYGSKYSDNVCWGNNRLEEEGVPRYDFYFYLYRNSLPINTPMGDSLISNNKFSSCCIKILNGIENAQKSYFVMNFIKGTFVRDDNALIVYDNNWNGWEPVDIGTVYTEYRTDSVQLNAKAWTPVVSLTVPVAGLYMIEGLFSSTVKGEQQGTIKIGNLNRNSYDYEMTDATSRNVYCPLAFVKQCSANEVLTLEVWDCNGITAGANCAITATRIG